MSEGISDQDRARIAHTAQRILDFANGSIQIGDPVQPFKQENDINEPLGIFRLITAEAISEYLQAELVRLDFKIQARIGDALPLVQR
jgi:hypothetical protein